MKIAHIGRAAALAAILTLAFSGFTAPVALAAEKKPLHVFKMATIAPKGTGWARQYEEIMLPEIQRATNGEVAFKCFWGGVMGDDEDIVKKMRLGQIDTAAVSGQGVGSICPAMTVLTLPFLFNDYGEVDYIREKMFASFDLLTNAQGFKLIFWIDQDFDQLYSTKYDFSSPEHFRQSKFLTWYGPVEEKCLEALGASPIPVNVPEAASSVRQGVVDALICPAFGIIGFQMQSQIRYMSPVKIRYSPALAVFSAKSWTRMPEKYRAPMDVDRDRLVNRFLAATRRDNEKALVALVRYGVRKTQIDPKAMDAMRRKTRPVWDALAGKIYTRHTLDEILRHLAEYRKTHRAA